MSVSRRQLLSASAGALALSTVGGGAFADTRVIRLLVGFPPGGGTDAIARVLAERLKDELQATVIVENKAGAGGQIAAQALKAAAPDGLTFFLSHDHTISILPMTVKQPGFDPSRDFHPVAGFATFPNAVALAGAPATGLKEFLAAAKTNPKGSSVGIPAPASVPEFLVKVMADKAGVPLTPIPYRGSGPMMADLFGSQIPAAVGSVPEFLEPHKAGKLKVVAVMGTQRHVALPDVPTLSELGFGGFEELPYYGVWAPAGTPQGHIDGFGHALLKVLQQPAVRERMQQMGLTVAPMTAGQLHARVQAYDAVWSKIIKASGFQAS